MNKKNVHIVNISNKNILYTYYIYMYTCIYITCCTYYIYTYTLIKNKILISNYIIAHYVYLQLLFCIINKVKNVFFILKSFKNKLNRKQCGKR